MKAQSSGIKLTVSDVRIIKAMLLRGDRQHDIAAWFGVNGGRIAEIATKKSFACVKPAVNANLPPSGPFAAHKVISDAMTAITTAKELLAAAEVRIKSLH